MMESIDALGSAKFFIQGEKFKEAKQVLDLVKPYCKTIAQLDAIGAEYANARDWITAGDIAHKLYNTVPDPYKANARQSLIRCLMNMNKPEDALLFIEEEQNYKQEPDLNLELEKAVALFMCNRKKESEDHLKWILLDNDCSFELKERIYFNLAIHKMAMGGQDFQRGLLDFLVQGRKLGIWKKADLPPHREWQGDYNPSYLPKTKLVVVAEGGIGDEIINIRFAKMISDKCGFDVRWKTDRKDLADVFERNGFSCDIKTIGNNWFWTYSMLLPVWLGLKEEELWDGPYLKPLKSATRVLAQQSFKGLKIGFKIQGNPYYEQDLHRTLPADKLENVFNNLTNQPNLFCFDIENAVDVHIKGWVTPNMGNYINTWDDTLDFLDQMDVVVTSCTSLAHAASAMGKKTFVLVPIMNYYIWARPGKTSPWYGPNTTVLRQTKPGNWDEPLDELKQILENYSP